MTRRNPKRSALALLATLLVTPWLAGCVTLAEFRKLEDDVWQMKQSGRTGSPDRTRVADLNAKLDALQVEVQRLNGELEVVQHRAAEALEEAKAARMAASRPGIVPAGSPLDVDAEVPAGVPPESSQVAPSGVPTDSPVNPEGPPDRVAAASGPPAAARSQAPPPTAAPPGGSGASSPEIKAYREAHTAWRENRHADCVDRFRSFLQTYPSSAHADDAAYWLADCYYKQGDYKTAVLRFDDVVARYPTGNKAPDALYRQGEALLRLGPGYSKAAGKAFERVLSEYPDSNRAREAQRQLDLLGSG